MKKQYNLDSYCCLYLYNMQVINCLNHAGICVSHTTTWKYLKQLTQQSRYTELLREGHWIWVFDNLNIHQKVRHERDGNKCNYYCTAAMTVKNRLIIYGHVETYLLQIITLAC